MLFSMKRRQFEEMELSALGFACFAPLIPSIRAKSPAVKEQVYAELTPGQQANFLFFVLHDHAKESVAAYYWWTAHYFGQPKAWEAIKGAMRVFGDEAMLALLEETEAALAARSGQEAKPQDLEEDDALLAAFARLYDRYRELAPGTLERIGSYIRNHPTEFVQIIE